MTDVFKVSEDSSTRSLSFNSWGWSESMLQVGEGSAGDLGASWLKNGIFIFLALF